ncbi:enoyl-CoA hydratase-related protein [Ihubacter massiliensis]|uniref:short-chain-enoyl-CoA hydratase n=1 Tax=Hominibacterium faecale TaxID=2839743 RepID=A0A9J6QS69_9FIRM|nr:MULTISPECIES: enoyl-CoA hydratase-related protein [Eubacteriales Family XIII. Incertae Sedis]MCO7122987.1 enoyl-CoA hydratase-related protein [Ihubacter massiliensis]MCU7377247.1 enoyl-CoA hydratase-related protein [Hominibacterium faecale]
MAQVLLKREENIAIIRVNRPEALNALSRSIIDEMDELVEEVMKDKEIRCLILHSEKNFAAGADIKKMVECNEEEARAFLFSPTYNKIADLSIPVIAAIEGYALGGGMELAMTADIRIAGEGAKMGFPEITLGIMPGAGGTIRVPRIIGEARAKELIFTGDVITAQKALSMGLVNRVAEDDHVLDEAMKLAKKLAKRAPIAMAMAKKTIKAGQEEQSHNKGIEIEAANWAKLFTTQDQKEGMRAFLEKRKPDFQNK